MGNYCVITRNSMDLGNTKVKLFQDEGMAQDYIAELWKTYMTEEINANNYDNLDKGLCYCDIDYAIIKWVDGFEVEFIESYAEF